MSDNQFELAEGDGAGKKFTGPSAHVQGEIEKDRQTILPAGKVKDLTVAENTLDTSLGLDQLYGKDYSRQQSAHAKTDDGEYRGLRPSEIDEMRQYKATKATVESLRNFNHWSVDAEFAGKYFGKHGPITKVELSQILKEDKTLSASQRQGIEFVRDNFASLSRDGKYLGRRDAVDEWQRRVSLNHVMVSPEPYLFNTRIEKALVEEGRKPGFNSPDASAGVLKANTPEQAERFKSWLDAKIPDNGTVEAEDKRTALIVKLALADASLTTDDPTEQAALAYVTLNTMRFMMSGPDGATESMNESVWNRMDEPTKQRWREIAHKGLSSDSGLANAEHFLETAHRVAGIPFDGGPDDASIFRGPDSAQAWSVISKVYNMGKNAGLISGSKASNQHKWETAGIEYGKASFDMTDAANNGTSFWRVATQFKHYVLDPKVRKD